MACGTEYFGLHRKTPSNQPTCFLLQITTDFTNTTFFHSNVILESICNQCFMEKLDLNHFDIPLKISTICLVRIPCILPIVFRNRRQISLLMLSEFNELINFLVF